MTPLDKTARREKCGRSQILAFRVIDEIFLALGSWLDTGIPIEMVPFQARTVLFSFLHEKKKNVNARFKDRWRFNPISPFNSSQTWNWQLEYHLLPHSLAFMKRKFYVCYLKSV